MKLHVLRVFTDAAGAHGNPLGVFVDGAAVPAEDRQRIAADLGFSEPVFVDHAAEGVCRIFTPASELAFAGHPTVGTSWLLDRLGSPVDALRPPAGVVATWQDGDLRWIRARPEWVHPITIERLASPAADGVQAVFAHLCGQVGIIPPIRAGPGVTALNVIDR